MHGTSVAVVTLTPNETVRITGEGLVAGTRTRVRENADGSTDVVRKGKGYDIIRHEVLTGEAARNRGGKCGAADLVAFGKVEFLQVRGARGGRVSA